MSDSNLITKYRPQTFKEVVGQDIVVRSLAGICKRKDAQVFLFSGPAGCGKTTLARLVSHAMGVEDSSILEIDGASFTGIDSMRSVQEMLQYRPFGTSGKRAIIIDEFHGLSRQALDSILKVIEEPPAHVIWCFCTTNVAKIPTTIKSRCAKFELQPVNDRVLGQLYDSVCDAEKIDLAGDVGDLIIREAKGSPRQLLANLSICRDAKDKKEASQLLKIALETDASLELCRFLAQAQGSWSTAMGILKKLENDNPESVRILVANYFAACLRNAKDDNSACVFMGKLDAFSQPYNGQEGMAPLLLSIGRVMFAE